MKKKTQILIVDDHPVVIDGVKKNLELEEDFVVIANCISLHDAKEVFLKQKIDCAIIDLNFKGETSGLQLVEFIKKNYPQTKCIIFSMFDERIHAKRALIAGASGYVMKQNSTDILIEAIRKVQSGSYYFSDEVTINVFASAAGHDSSEFGYNLTPKEFEIFRFIGQGKTSREIGKLLNISPKTVESHKNKLKDKIGCSNPTELISLAIEYMKEDYITKKSSN